MDDNFWDVPAIPVGSEDWGIRIARIFVIRLNPPLTIQDVHHARGQLLVEIHNFAQHEMGPNPDNPVLNEIWP